MRQRLCACAGRARPGEPETNRGRSVTVSIAPAAASWRFTQQPLIELRDAMVTAAGRSE